MHVRCTDNIYEFGKPADTHKQRHSVIRLVMIHSLASPLRHEVDTWN